MIRPVEPQDYTPEELAQLRRKERDLLEAISQIQVEFYRYGCTPEEQRQLDSLMDVAKQLAATIEERDRHPRAA